MGLLDKRTLDKAKRLAVKNKEKIADTVDKATDAIDKRTGGKHHDKLRKLDDAAAKFAGREPTDSPGADTPVTDAADAGADDEPGTSEA